MEKRRVSNPAQFQKKLLPYRSKEPVLLRNRNPGLRINDPVFPNKGAASRTKDGSPGFRHSSPVLRSPVRDDCLLIMCLGENRKKVLWRKHDPRRVLFKWKVCNCWCFSGSHCAMNYDRFFHANCSTANKFHLFLYIQGFPRICAPFVWLMWRSRNCICFYTVTQVRLQLWILRPRMSQSEKWLLAYGRENAK